MEDDFFSSTYYGRFEKIFSGGISVGQAVFIEFGGGMVFFYESRGGHLQSQGLTPFVH